MKIQLIRYLIQLVYLGLFSFTFIVSLNWFLLLTLILTIVGGPFFCGWFCPFGTIQEVMNNIRLIFNKKPFKLPKKVHGFLIFFRYFLLILIFIGFTFLYIFDVRVSFLDLISGQILSIFSYSLIFLFLLISLFMDRPFCNYFCPEGAQFGLIGLLRIFRIKRNKSTCVDCKLCDKNCPMNIEVSKKDYVNSPQCINCFKCVSSCPKKGTLNYGLIDFKFKK
jgi:polyferredoxin